MGKVVFLLSPNRSGSTLLDQLLGAHPDVTSLGEVHWMAAYVREDRELYNPAHPLVCSCGSRVLDCSFWREVAAVLNQPLDQLKLRLDLTNSPGLTRKTGLAAKLARQPYRALVSHPWLFRSAAVQRFFGGPRLASDTARLFDAIFDVTGSRYLVDSCKTPYRFRAIYDQEPNRARAILLARDYRAVAHSIVKRGGSLKQSGLAWKRDTEAIEALTSDIPDEHKYRLTYESLCLDPRSEMERICRFLDLEFSEVMLERPTTGIHHIGGSPSKFDPSKAAIKLDESYKRAFSNSELADLRRIVGEVAEVWGY